MSRFVESARSYCKWIEGNVGSSVGELQQARLLLTQLHLAALALPNVGVGVEIVTSHRVSPDEWRALLEKLFDLPVSGYWVVFDPLHPEKVDPVYNSLADDLADIYSNIKDNLNLFDDGHVSEAVWEWRFSFLTHWGRHLTSAQRALHSHFQHEKL